MYRTKFIAIDILKQRNCLFLLSISCILRRGWGEVEKKCPRTLEVNNQELV